MYWSERVSSMRSCGVRSATMSKEKKIDIPQQMSLLRGLLQFCKPKSYLLSSLPTL